MSNINIAPSDITYNWVIIQLDTKPSVDGLEDYVVQCHYRYNGTYQDIIKEVYGICSFETNPNLPNFTPYSELTENDIISWLEQTLDLEPLQNTLTHQINETLNPPIIVLPLPWTAE